MLSRRTVTRYLLAALMFSCFFHGGSLHAESVRNPAVSGFFYSSDPEELKDFISKVLQKTEKTPFDGEVMGLVVPHAGYVYSGHVAAWAYVQAQGKTFDTVVIIGPSHRAMFPGASVGNYDFYHTPLGNVPVEKEIVSKLLQDEKWFHFYPLAHKPEHSLEVQVPFLQFILEGFSIVPVLLSEFSLESSKEIAHALLKATEGKKVLFIASTDLSHYHPYAEAVEKDRKSIEAIRKMSPEGFFEAVKNKDCEMCGHAAVLTLLFLARESVAKEIKLLQYANSGDVPSGDRRQVVGYAAMAVVK